MRALLFVAVLGVATALLTKDGSCVCSGPCVMDTASKQNMCPVFDGVVGCSATAGMAACDVVTAVPTLVMTSPTGSPPTVARGGTVTLNVTRPSSPQPAVSYNITVMEDRTSWTRVVKTISSRDTRNTTVTWAVPLDLAWPAPGASRIFRFKITAEDDPAFPNGAVPGATVTPIGVTVEFPSTTDLYAALKSPLEGSLLEEGKPFRVSILKSGNAWLDTSSLILMAKDSNNVAFKLMPSVASDASISASRFAADSQGALYSADYSFPAGALAGGTSLAGKTFSIYLAGSSGDLQGWYSGSVSVTVLPKGTAAAYFTKADTSIQYSFGSYLDVEYGLLNANCNASSPDATRIAVSAGAMDAKGQFSNEVFISPGGPSGFIACRDINPSKGAISLPLVPNGPFFNSSGLYFFRIKIVGGAGASDAAYVPVQQIGSIQVSVFTNRDNAFASITLTNLDAADFPVLTGGTPKTISWTVVGTGLATTCAAQKVVIFVTVSHSWGVERIPLLASDGTSTFTACSANSASFSTPAAGTATALVPAWLPRQMTSNARLTIQVVTGTYRPFDSFAPIVLAGAAATVEPTLTLRAPLDVTNVTGGAPLTISFMVGSSNNMPTGFDCNSGLAMSPTVSRVSFELRVPMADGTWWRRPLVPKSGADADGSVPACSPTAFTNSVTVDIPAMSATMDYVGALIVAQVTSGQGLGAMAMMAITLGRNAAYVVPMAAPSPFNLGGVMVPTVVTATNAMPSLSINSTHTVVFTPSGFDCTSSTTAASTTRSMGTLELVTSQGTFVLRERFAVCVAGMDTTQLENVWIWAKGLSLADSAARLVVRVTSGLGMGASFALPVAVTLPNMGTQAIRFTQPAPMPLFDVMNPTPTNITAGSTYELKWALTGAGITCGSAASDTMVVLMLRYKQWMTNVSVDTGAIFRYSITRYWPISTVSGSLTAVQACSATDGNTRVMAGSYSWAVPMIGVYGVSNAEIVVAVVPPSSTISSALFEASTTTMAVVGPVNIVAIKLLQPVPGQTFPEGTNLTVRWMVDPAIADCSSSVPDLTKIATATMTGRSIAQVFLVLPAFGTSFSWRHRAVSEFFVACNPDGVGQATIFVDLSLPAGVFQIAVAIVSGKGGNGNIVGMSDPVPDVTRAIKGITNGTVTIGNPSTDLSKAIRILQPKDGKQLNSGLSGDTLSMTWTVDTTQVDCSSGLPSDFFSGKTTGRSFVEMYIGSTKVPSTAFRTSSSSPNNPGGYFACYEDGRGYAAFSTPSTLPTGVQSLSVYVATGKGYSFSSPRGTMDGNLLVGPTKYFVTQPMKDQEFMYGGLLYVKWYVDAAALDCASQFNQFADPASTSGRSNVQIFVKGSDGILVAASPAMFPACSASMNGGWGNITIGDKFPSGSVQIYVVVTSGKGSSGSAVDISKAVQWSMGGSIVIKEPAGALSFTTNAAVEYKPLWITAPVNGQTVKDGATLTVQWMANTTQLDCTSAPDDAVSTRSYVQLYSGGPMAFTLSQGMLVSDTSYLACDSTGRGWANVTVMATRTADMMGNFPWYLSKLAVVVTKGRGISGSTATAKEASLRGLLQGFICVGCPENSASSYSPGSDGRGLSNFQVSEPADGVMIHPNRTFQMRWSITNSSLLDCTSPVPDMLTRTTMTGRSMVQVHIAKPDATSFSQAKQLPGWWPACGPMSPMMGGANITLPFWAPYGNMILAVVVASGKGSMPNLDNSTGGISGTVKVGPAAPPRIDFTFPGPAERGMVFSAAVNPKIVLSWRAVSLICTMDSPNLPGMQSRVKVELVIPNSQAPDSPFMRMISPDEPACDANGLGMYEVLLPADVPPMPSVRFAVTVIKGFGNGTVMSMSSTVGLRGMQYLTITSPSPGSLIRVPPRSMLASTSKAISWNTGYLSCSYPGNPPEGVDMVSIHAFKASEVNATAKSVLDLMGKMPVWTHMFASDISSWAACTSTNNKTGVFSSGVDSVILPPELFMVETPYSLVLAIYQGPNAGLISTPVPFVVTKPVITRVMPMAWSAPSGGLFTLSWNAMGLASDELCRILIGKDTSNFMVLATVKCMDQKASFMLTDNATKMNIPEGSGYGFGVNLVEASGYLSTSIYNTTAANFAVLKGARIIDGSLSIRLPSAPGSPVTTVSAGSRVFVTFGLGAVPDMSSIVLTVCHETLNILPDPVTGVLGKCGVVFEGLSPQNLTTLVVPFTFPVSAGYTLSLVVMLAGTKTVLPPASLAFSVSAPAIENAKFSIVDPIQSLSTAISQRFNVSWVAQGLDDKAMFVPELYRDRDMMLVANLTPNAMVVPVTAGGGMCQATTCKGRFVVMGLDNSLIPSTADREVFRVCVRHVTVNTLKDCSAPITIFKEIQPMLRPRLVMPATMMSDSAASMSGTSIPIFKVGDSVVLTYESQAISSIVLTLMSTASGFTAPPSVTIDTRVMPMGQYPWPIPADFFTATTISPDQAGTLFYVNIKSVGLPTTISINTGAFAIVPAAGVLAVRVPTGGSTFDLSKPLLIAWSAVAVTKNLTIKLVDPSVTPMVEVVTLARGVSPMWMSWVWGAAQVTATALNFAADTLARKFVVRISTDDNTLVAMSQPFVVQRPPMRIETVTLKFGNGTDMPLSGTTVRLSDSVIVNWKAAGLAFGATGTLFLAPSDIAWDMLSSTDRDRLRWISANVPLTTTTSFTFALSGKFEVGVSYRVYLVLNGADGVVGMGPAPGFKVDLPQNGFALFLTPPSAMDGGSFIVGSEDSKLMINWVTTVNGVRALDDGAVSVMLENRLMPGWSRITSFSPQPATQAVAWVLPTDLDLTPGISSAYYLRAVNSVVKMNATSPLFTAAPPKAFITVTSPTQDQVFDPSKTSDATQNTITAAFTVAKLPGMTTTEMPFVNVSVVNAFIKGPLWWKMMQADPTMPNTASFALPSDYKPPVGGERSFFVIVRSVQFPSVGGSSAPFSIRVALQDPPKMVVTSIGVGTAATTTDTTGAPLTAVVKDTLVPTLSTMVTNPMVGVAGGMPVTVSVILRNARSDLRRNVSSAEVTLSASGAISFPLIPKPLEGLKETMNSTQRDWFFYTFWSAQNPRLNVNSSFFTIAPSTAVTIRLLSPAAPLSRLPGETLPVSWASAGLADAATVVSIELVNDVLGKLLLLADGQATMGAISAVKIPSTAPASPFWYVRVNASSTVFAQSPLIEVMTAQSVSIQVASPNGAVVALTGQPIDIAWRSFAAEAYTLTISLMNELINGNDFILKIAEGIPSASGKTTWMVPTTLRTSLDVRRSYQLKFTLYDSNGLIAKDANANPVFWTSELFAIASREAFVSALSPMAGDVYTVGDSLKVTFSARNIKNSTYRIGLVNDGLKALWTLSEGVEVTSFDAASGASSGSFTWMIPTSLPVTPSAASSWSIVITPLALPTATARAGTFTIRSLGSPYQVLSPAKDTVVNNGTQTRVVFTMSSDAANSDGASKVNITLCNRMSTAEVMLASGVSSTASMVLIPGNVPTGSAVRSTYFIRVSPAVANTGFMPAESDVFTITAQSNVIRVVTPSVGAAFTRGDRIGVQWAASPSMSGSNVRIEIANTRTLAKAVLGFATLGMAVSSGWIESDGLFAIPASLPIPTNKDDAGRFIIRVVSTSDESIFDMSSRFNISLPSQVIRVFKTTFATDSPAPMAGEKVNVYWAALALASDAKISIFLRNMTADSTVSGDDSNLMAVGTAMVGKMESCSAWGFVAPTTADAGGQTWVCGMFQVPVEDMHAKPALLWSIVVRSSDDVLVSAASRVFIVRPKSDPLMVTFVKPSEGFQYVVGQALPIQWTASGSSASLTAKVDIMCVSPSAGEMSVATMQAVALSSGQPSSAFTLKYSDLSGRGEDRFAKCFVQLTSTSSGANGNAAVIRSAMFSIRMPDMGVNLVTPAPMRTTLSASSVSVASTATASFLSGSGLGVSWNFLTTDLAASSYGNVMVVLRRVNLAEGTSEQVYTFWPSPSAKLGSDGMSLTAASNLIPGSLPFGLYSIQISASVAGVNRVFVDNSMPFFVKPLDPSLTVVQPVAGDKVAAGGLVRIAYASKGIAASNRVMITLSQVDGNKKMWIVTNSTEATGVFTWAVPVNIITAAEADTKLTFRVSLLENPDIKADSGAFTITRKEKYLTVDWPAPMPDGRLPIWKSEEQVWVNFTASGYTEFNAVSVELWQDRFFVATGGDKKLAVLASSVPLVQTAAGSSMMTGSFSLPVPSDLDSTALVYVVVKPVTTDAALAKVSGRSKPFPIRSAPVPGLTDFLANLCGALWTSDGSSNVASPVWVARMPALKAFCAKSCAQCTSDGSGVWMPAVSLQLDFQLNWLGGQRDLRLFKNLMGAFRGDGSNICWPKALLANSTSTSGTYSFGFSDITYYNDLVQKGTAYRINATMPRLTATQVAKPLYTCTAVQPTAKSVFNIPNVDPSSLTPAALADLITKIKKDILDKLIAAGIPAVEGDITVNFDATSSTSTTSSSTTITANSRRLQTSSGSGTSGNIATSTSSDADAQQAGASMSGGSSTVPGMSTGDAQVSTTDQQSSTGTTGGTSSGNPVTTTDGSTSKAPSADNNEDQSTSAFSPGGIIDTLTTVAKNRDIGVSAVTGGTSPTPTPGPAAPANSSGTNSGGIIGGVIGAIVIIGILGFVGMVVYKNNQAKKRSHGQFDHGAGTGLHNPVQGKATNTSSGAKATKVEEIAMVNNPLKGPTHGQAMSIPSGNRFHMQPVGTNV